MHFYESIRPGPGGGPGAGDGVCAGAPHAAATALGRSLTICRRRPPAAAALVAGNAGGRRRQRRLAPVRGLGRRRAAAVRRAPAGRPVLGGGVRHRLRRDRRGAHPRAHARATPPLSYATSRGTPAPALASAARTAASAVRCPSSRPAACVAFFPARAGPARPKWGSVGSKQRMALACGADARTHARTRARARARTYTHTHYTRRRTHARTARARARVHTPGALLALLQLHAPHAPPPPADIDGWANAVICRLDAAVSLAAGDTGGGGGGAALCKIERCTAPTSPSPSPAPPAPRPAAPAPAPAPTGPARPLHREAVASESLNAATINTQSYAKYVEYAKYVYMQKYDKYALSTCICTTYAKICTMYMLPQINMQ